jgi:hypothetical protein
MEESSPAVLQFSYCCDRLHSWWQHLMYAGESMLLTEIHVVVVHLLLRLTASKLGQSGIPGLDMHATICRASNIQFIQAVEAIGGIRTMA